MRKNTTTQKEEIDQTIGMLEKDQISNESEKGTDFDVQKEADKESSLGYAKLDDVTEGTEGTEGNPNPIIPKSMDRFCFDHTDKLESIESLKGEHKTNPLKVGKTDDTASGQTK